jgi:hypothetical protein
VVDELRVLEWVRWAVGMLVLAVGVTLLFARDVGGVLNLVTSNMGLKWYSNSNQLGATIFDRCGSGEI